MASRLGAHTSVVIDGTTRYSSVLTAGEYDLYAEGEGCYVRELTAASGTVDATNAYIPAGGGVTTQRGPGRFFKDM